MNAGWNVLIAYRSVFRDTATGPMMASDKAIRSAADRTSAASIASGRKLSESLAASSRSMQQIGRSMTTFVTLPVVAAGAASLKLATDFNASMGRVAALTEAGRKNFEKWSSEILNIAPKLGVAPKELSDALYFVASAGLKTSQVMPVLTTASKAAAAGMGDFQTIADALTSTMNAYAGTGLSAAEATDILVQTVKVGKAEPEQLAESLGRILSPAAQLGVSFNDLGGGIAALTNRGLDAAEAVTGLRQILFTLIHPAVQTKDTMKDLGLSAEGLRDSLAKKGLLPTLVQMRKAAGDNDEALGKLFPNIRAFNAFLALTGKDQLPGVIKSFNSLNKATGATDRAFQQIRKTTQFKFNQAFSQLKVDLIEIGNLMLPTANKVLESIFKMLKAFEKLDDGTKETIVKFAGIGAAIGPVIFFLGKFIALGLKIGGVFQNLKLGVGPIAAIALGALVIYKNWSKVTPIIKDVGNIIADLVRTANDFISGDWDKMWSDAANAVTDFGSILEHTMDLAKAVISEFFSFATSSVQGFIVASIGLAIVSRRVLGLVQAFKELAAVQVLLGTTNAVRGASAAGQFGAGAAGAAGFIPVGGLGGGSRLNNIAAGVRGEFLVEKELAQKRLAMAEFQRLGAAGLSPRGPGGKFISAAEFTAMNAGVQKIGSLRTAMLGARAGALGLGEALGPLAVSLGPAGLAVGVAATAIGLEMLVSHLLSGASAVDQMHNSVVNFSSNVGKFSGAATQVASGTTDIARERLAITGFKLQLEEQRKALAGTKKGSLEYKQALLSLQETQLSLTETQANLKASTEARITQLKTLRSTSADLIKGLPKQLNLCLPVQTLAKAKEFLSPTQLSTLTATLGGLRDQTLSVGDAFKQVQGIAGGALTRFVSRDMLQNIHDSGLAVQQLTDTLPKLKQAFNTAVAGGSDPFSKGLQRTLGIIGQTQAALIGLSNKGVAHLVKNLGRPLHDAELKTLSTLGGLPQGVKKISQELGRIPNLTEIGFLQGQGTRGVNKGIQEFIRDLHQIPSKKVIDLLVQHKGAQQAIAAFVATTKKVPNKKQLAILTNIPNVAIPDIAKLIRATGKIPSKKQIKVTVTRAEKDAKVGRDLSKLTASIHVPELKGKASLDTSSFQAAVKKARGALGGLDNAVNKKRKATVGIVFNPANPKNAGLQAGRDVVAGIDAGAAEGGNLAGILSSYIAGAVASAKASVHGAHATSPSKRTKRELGIPLVQGIVAGITENKHLAANAMMGLLDGTTGGGGGIGGKIAKGVIDGISKEAARSGNETTRNMAAIIAHRIPPPPPPPGGHGGSGGGGGSGGHSGGVPKWYLKLYGFMKQVENATSEKAGKAALQRFSRAVRGISLAHAVAIEKTLRRHMSLLQRGSEDKEQTQAISRLRKALNDVDKSVTKRLQRINNLFVHRQTLAQGRLDRLSLRQQLAGTDQTPGSAQARADFITKKLEPLIREQLHNLRKQEKAARGAGKSKLARDIAESISDKQTELLQAQLDAQTAIKDATQSTADSLSQLTTTGNLGFGFGGGVFRDLVGVGVGA